MTTSTTDQMVTTLYLTVQSLLSTKIMVWIIDTISNVSVKHNEEESTTNIPRSLTLCYREAS